MRLGTVRHCFFMDMLGFCTNRARASQFTTRHRNIHANSSLLSMFRNLGFPNAAQVCPENTLGGPKTTACNPKKPVCPPLAASCRRSAYLNSTKGYTLRGTHLIIFCACRSSIRQFQSEGRKGHGASELPHFEAWAGTNTIICLRPLPLLGSCYSFPSSQLSQLGSLFSSLISPTSSFSVSSQPFSPSPYGTDRKRYHLWRCASRGEDDDKGGESSFSDRKPVMAVILLGWLGAQQKHLSRYADWYTARGIHAVTFVVPMKDLLSFKPGGRVEQHIELLAGELASWMSEKEKDGRERCIMFHTFSNTGWLTYGVILEKLMKREDLYEKIKGCVIDSAPDPEPNPQVWALGFSAALLKKRSALLHSALDGNGEILGLKDGNRKLMQQLEPPFPEAALLAILEKFFSVMLKLPYINERLSKLISILSKNQPPCPQLYIYSTADRVIPVESVESFIDEQKKAGKKVRACNLKLSPHVDHFRSFPDIYSEQLHIFLKECTQIVG